MVRPMSNLAACIIGVDPGVQGGIAVLWGMDDGSASFVGTDVISMPLKAPAYKKKTDWAMVRWAFVETLRMADEKDCICLMAVEVPFYNPKIGQRTFGYQVRHAQRLWGMAYMAYIPCLEVEVWEWKRILPAKLHKEESAKDRARRFVRETYGVDGLDDGKADAACIGHHAWSQLWRNTDALENLKRKSQDRIDEAREF